mgnify:CR=1 FL=1
MAVRFTDLTIPGRQICLIYGQGPIHVASKPNCPKGLLLWKKKPRPTFNQYKTEAKPSFLMSLGFVAVRFADLIILGRYIYVM